jgi:hypothetical protein
MITEIGSRDACVVVSVLAANLVSAAAPIHGELPGTVIE